jgi:murein DD-endopeptidase MepM/ murein hydrolase activator NlpD
MFLKRFNNVFVFALMLGLVFSASVAEAAITLACPKAVPLGQAFLVRVTSTDPVSSVSIGWMSGKYSPEVSKWNGRDVAVEMLGTDVLSDKPGKKKVVIKVTAAGKEQEFKRTIRIVAKKYPVQKLTLPKKMVTPPTEVYTKIKQDRKESGKALSTYSTHRDWFLPLERPVAGSLSSTYGLRRILNGKPKNPHRGLDFRGAKGTPIKAVADGKVLLARKHYYAGNSLYIDHGNGVISLYFHLSEFDVKEGDTVERGQVVGRIGSTGRVTGPHLHLSISVNGKLVDPKPLLEKNADALLGAAG